MSTDPHQTSPDQTGPDQTSTGHTAAAVRGPLDQAPTVLRSEVTGALHGERVDRAVALLTGLSRRDATDLVAGGGVRVNGTVVTARSQRLGDGQELLISWEPSMIQTPPLAPAPELPVEIVYADDWVIVVNKAPGVVVHPGSGVVGPTLVQGLLARFPELVEVGATVGEVHRPGIVHRLDRGTSGLLVVARTPAADEALVAQLSNHTVHRQYRALVIGQPSAAAGLIDAPIGRSRHDPTRRAVTASGRAARTRYHLEETFDRPESLALLSCELETGRTHQIRVHLQAIGLAVVADGTYGGGRLRLGLQRPFLHAVRLAFNHPGHGGEVSFDSPLAKDLQAVLDGLRVLSPADGPDRG